MHRLFRSPRRTFVTIAVAYIAIVLFAEFTWLRLLMVAVPNYPNYPWESGPPEGFNLALAILAQLLALVAHAGLMPFDFQALGLRGRDAFLAFLAFLAVNALVWAIVVTAAVEVARILRRRLSHR